MCLCWLVGVRGGMKQAQGGSRPVAQQPTEPPRSVVIEEPTCRMGGPVFKQVKPKTYQVLESELPASEQGQGRTRYFYSSSQSVITQSLYMTRSFYSHHPSQL